MRISNEDSSVSFKLCLNSWECCHDVSPSPPLSPATTMNSEEPDRLWNDCNFPSEGSNTGEGFFLRGIMSHNYILRILSQYLLHNHTSRELCSNLACLQVPADFSRVEGLATRHDRDRLYLHSRWSKVKLPGDSSHRGAFSSSYVHLKKEIQSGHHTCSLFQDLCNDYGMNSFGLWKKGAFFLHRHPPMSRCGSHWLIKSNNDYVFYPEP